MKHITSVQNPFVKQLVQLQEKAKSRRQSGTFLIEGRREIELALKGGYEIETLLFEEKTAFDFGQIREYDIELVEISQDVYQKLAYRDSTEGVIAVARSKNLSLSELVLPDNALVLVAESPEKPGNIGAMLRTADAANVDAVIIADPKSDMYNPNIVRSSVGCLFTNQIATGTTPEVIAFLNDRNIAIYAAALQDSVAYHEQDFRPASALAVGTEATGLTQEWRDAARRNIRIPMQGVIDSMNVSVAAAVLIFEAKRQRGF